MRNTLALLGFVLLAACGRKVDLRPAPSAALPVKPATAATQPGPADLLAPTPQARPARIDEGGTRSRTREPDRFDLPPAG